MKRLVRINGNVKAIITGDLLANCKEIDGIMQYPVFFFGEPDFVPVIVKNENHFNITVGEKTSNLYDWSF